MVDLSKEIRAYALKNALEYDKADPEKILPKLFQHGLEKKDIKKIIHGIKEIVKEVNSLSKNKLEKEYLLYKKFLKEREEKEKTLPELPNISGKVVTRLPPEPSKYLHVGHALSFLINSIYAERYKGKCLLRFEDANPERVRKEYADAILDDIKNYLQIKIDSVHYVSDDIEIMYKYAQKLIDKGEAFICFCNREEMQNLRHKGKECPCRKHDIKKNKEHWRDFLAGKYKEGEAVLRLKGDMKSLNHVMRDPVLFRAIYSPHFRHGSKYKVWPMYDFYNPIEDSLMKVTHILRSNEFDIRVELHMRIKELLGLNKQELFQYGRFNIIGAETKGREIREKIESGEYSGWDDPRLVTLRALRRRGIRPEVLYELVKYIGLSKKPINIDYNMIASISRKLLDKKVNRYYFVPNPYRIKIEGMPDIAEVKVQLHPDRTETRTLKVREEIYIDKEDYEKYKGKEVRLMNLCNIRLEKKINFSGETTKSIQKIQWVSDAVPVKIKMSDGSWLEGLSETNIKDLNAGDLIQFERFGFVRLDKKDKNEYEFWFAHK